ncbi:MAG: chemotaxis response regulator protein-glutamate methylesterase [Flammeovirgaceae bacterium]|nr:chemotaxis response regulator protein-glutamate methylesterase [Flammeovirgaceae bacterium]MBE63522.1 chemotaxis response regulator protein-glutamate methylesterase [Flammeovirgaceae bacterium]MBR08505.1 chemotaxis response regulator protein-glutamate methylesterase [Rickettsiales bacterium]HCX21957.1 chemotaxis response regulator protein-glutamate methylesterase [Cytophagales bacterium]
MRLLLTDLLSKDDELNVVGSAVDGKEAVQLVKECRPDVVLLDMNMGEYDGLYAVERIMKVHPVPILILSSVGNSNLDPIFDALELGAVDYINKPQKGGSKVREIGSQLVATVKRVARAKPKATKIEKDGLNKLSHTFDTKANYHVIVIGASTGGPTAVEKVITSFPANLNVPVLLGQHMPPNFIKSFAARLDFLSPLKVVVGKKGMIPKAGMVIIAPGDTNMIVVKDKNDTPKIAFSDEVYREYNNPSINALMTSAASAYADKAIGVLLTGMGKDGVKGMQAIKDSGGRTIAQDESSSVIYGMPKIAFETGAADTVLDIREIGGYLVNCL